MLIDSATATLSRQIMIAVDSATWRDIENRKVFLRLRNTCKVELGLLIVDCLGGGH